ncbi:MAG TPA: serine/threonine-protein kinase [Polyangiaceae bacterium]
MLELDLDEEELEVPSLKAGAIIGAKYRIENRIGLGGMGSIWAATHVGLGQRVAVKLISYRYARSREARQRFALEAKAAAQLRSRYVVQVYDNGEMADRTPYIVMELLEGESLEQRIARIGPLPIDATLRVVSHVARALSRAHSVGIVHRDLKPENIFLTHDDDEEIAKVLDFGIAKLLSTEKTNSATCTGAVIGTPLFMSPEQARGLKSVDHRTDVYSLGMVTFTMLTGRTAFAGESPADVLVSICTQSLPSICQLAPRLPLSVDDWFARACARDPAHRFGSTEELVEALYAALDIARPNHRTTELSCPGTSEFDETSESRRIAVPRRAQPSSPDDETPSTLSLNLPGSRKRSLATPLLLLVGSLIAVVAAAAFFAVSRRQATSPASPTVETEPALEEPEVLPAPLATGSPEVASVASSPSASADAPVASGTDKVKTPAVTKHSGRSKSASPAKRRSIDLGF